VAAPATNFYLEVRYEQLDGTEKFSFSSWIESEKERKRLSMKEGSRFVRRNRLTFEQLDPVFFWETFGVLPEELSELCN